MVKFFCYHFIQSLLILLGFLLLNVVLQAEGIPVSPYIVRKAIENTSVPIGGLAEDKLSTGQGLLQVDKLEFCSMHFPLLTSGWKKSWVE